MFNLRRHMCSVHNITMDCAKSELEKCGKADVSREEFAESKKPVYITLMDSQYSDISSDELEYEDVSSDEDALEEMEAETQPCDTFSVTSSFLEQVIRDEPVVDDFVDNLLSQDSDMDCTDRDSDMDTSEVAESNASRTTVISLTMVKTETSYPDGQTETVRNTIISHSDNVDPDNLDLSDIAMEILTEVPNHFNNRDVKVIEL